MRELTGTSGHLSQSAPLAFFGNPKESPLVELEARWPDGATVTRAVKPGTADRITLRRTDS